MSRRSCMRTLDPHEHTQTHCAGNKAAAAGERRHRHTLEIVCRDDAVLVETALLALVPL